MMNPYFAEKMFQLWNQEVERRTRELWKFSSGRFQFLNRRDNLVPIQVSPPSIPVCYVD